MDEKNNEENNLEEQERARQLYQAQRRETLREKAEKIKKTAETVKKTVETGKKVFAMIRSLGFIISFLITSWPVVLGLGIFIIIIVLIAWIESDPAEATKMLGETIVNVLSISKK